MMPALKVLLVGAGVIGQLHADVIAANPNLTLHGIVDARADAAQALAAKHGSPSCYSDYEVALTESGADIVALCTPSGLQCDQAIAAVRAGYHVVIEKPLDVAAAQGEALLRVMQECAPAIVTVISQHRFDPGSQHVKAAIAAGGLGQLTSATASVPWFRSQAYFDGQEWRGTWALDGGGALMNQGVHTVDLLLWFMGRPVEVFAYAGCLAHERIEVEDTLTALVKFESGALATVHASTASYPGRPVRLGVHGSRGSAELVADTLTYLHVQAPGTEPGPYGEMNAANQAAAASEPDAKLMGTAHAAQYDDLVAAIRTGSEVAVTVESAQLALRVVSAAYESARTGHPVKL